MNRILPLNTSTTPLIEVSLLDENAWYLRQQKMCCHWLTQEPTVIHFLTVKFHVYPLPVGIFSTEEFAGPCSVVLRRSGT